MITRENFKEVCNELTNEELENALYADGDYVKLELHIFNAGYFVTIESTQYDEDEENEVTSNGNIYGDKDEVFRMIDEVRNA